jgi:hypothetical protein
MALLTNTFQTNQVYNTSSGPAILTTTYNQPFVNYTNFPAKLVVPYMVQPSYDTGMNDNFFAQKQMTKYIQMKILDKYLYDDLSYILKYMKVSDGVVKVVKNKEEANSNDVSADTRQTIELKADYLEKNMLDMDKMRRLLTKIVSELGYKWYNLSRYEGVICEVVGKYLKNKLKENFSL